MKNLYLLLFFMLGFACLHGQDEPQLPAALVGSCVEPDSNLIVLFLDYSKNCSEADPSGLLIGREELGFHSGANQWEVTVPFDDPNALRMTNLGNDIFTVEINTMDYYGKPVADLEKIVFIARSAVASDPWGAEGGGVRDETGMGGFGNDELCDDFEVFISALTVCSEVVQESSASLFGATTIANSCVDTVTGEVRIDFDLSLNCPEADPGSLLVGVTELGFHSGANTWASQVQWDADGAKTASNNGNDIFSVTIDPVAYYDVVLDSLDNITFLLNNGLASPSAPWDNTGKDERDGGFGGAEPCSDLILKISEIGACPIIPVQNSSESILSVTGADISTCVDPSTGKVRISFDLSQNCPEADSTNALAGTAALGFHSGANNWAQTVVWDADTAMQAKNNGSDIFTVTIDVQAYYGIPFDSLRNIEFLFNNGIADPDNPWVLTGKDPRNGGFGGDEPCSNLLLDISEASTCDLADAKSSNELFEGLASSCVDPTNAKIRLDFDMSLNCAEADPGGLLANADTIGFHSGGNNWSVQVPWDADTAMAAVNDGNGLYSLTIDVASYYGISIDSLTEVNFLYNNGHAATSPDSIWTNTGKDAKGGDDPCANFLFVLAEAPVCDLAEVLSSNELFEGLASSCVDASNGKIKLDFDMNLNCAEADPGGLLANADTIGFHSGANNWNVQVPWDTDTAMMAINDGNGLYSLVIDVQDYYGMSLDSLSEVNFLYNNGFANPSATWDNTGKDALAGGGFGGTDPCSNFLFVVSEAPSCDLTVKVSSTALVSGLASSCVDPTNGKIKLEFDLNQNCAEADPGNLLAGAGSIGFHSGVNNWAAQVQWDSENAVAATNDGNDLFTVIVDAQAYYGMPLSEINEINFLYNNGFGEASDPWANTGKDSTGMGGFGGDEPCDNMLFIPSSAAVCDLPTAAFDIQLEQSLRVSPNPFSDQVLIEFDNPNNKRYQLMLVDMTGKVVRHLRGITGEQVRLQREQMPTGMYFAHLIDEKGQFATAKLIVQ